MHDMPDCEIHCCTEYLQHNCIAYAQQFTNSYILISAAEIIYVAVQMLTCFVHIKILLRVYFRLRATNLH